MTGSTLMLIALSAWAAATSSAVVEETAAAETGAPGMFRGDAAHRGDYGLPAIRLLTLKWRFATGGKVRSSPVVAGDLVLVGSEDGHLYAVDRVSGSERWRVETGARVFSSPAVAGGVVYLGTWNGDLLGLAVADGSRKAITMAESAIMSSPALANGVLFVGSDDSQLYAFSGTPYDPAAEPKAIELPEESLRKLAGTYRDADGETYSVTVDADHLVITAGDQSLQLFPASESEFFFKELVTTVRFIRRGNGSADRLEFVLGEDVTPAEKMP